MGERPGDVMRATATTDPGEPEVVIAADEEGAARAAAERIASVLVDAIAVRGIARWATTGGSAPGPIYRALIEPPLRDRVDWRRVDVWFGDDRFVPRLDRLSNLRLVDEVLLGPDGVPIPLERIHPVPVDAILATGGGPPEAADQYAAELAAEVPSLRGWPAFDLVIVGIGPDGHVLSVFPGSEAIGAVDTVLPIPAPTHVEPHVPRVTLNPAFLDVAPHLFAIAFSGSKAGILGEIFGPLRDEERWPSQRARRSGATWFLDDAAAAKLPAEIRSGGSGPR